MEHRRGWWSSLAAARSGKARPGQARRGLSVLAVCALVLAVLMPLSLTPPWRLLELRIFDYLSTLHPPPRPEGGPIVVAIDEPSFAEIGQQWPWPRDLHASLVQALRKAGARVIGVDIIFAEPSAKPGADAALAAAMGRDVVLASDVTTIQTPQADQVVRVEPLPDLTEAGAKSGLSSVVLDGDGTLRRAPRYPDGFAATLLSASGQPVPDVPSGALLQVFGPSRTYPTVSYYQALDPENFLPKGTFEGRTVIIGLSMQSAPTVKAGGADAFATAQTLRTGRLVSGAEIQATIVDNLRAGLLVRPAGEPVLVAAAAFAVALAGLAVRRATGWRTAAGSLAAVILCVAASYVLLRFGRVFVPPLTPAVAFALVAGGQGARDYAAERQLRRGITRAFSQYLSPVLVDRLASDPDRLVLGGETRTLTILFCDVRGFTTIAETMKDDPQRLTALVNRLLNPLSNAILAAGGTIDKYIGDAIMAFWNAPLDDPDHARHAVEGALAMLSALDVLNAELAGEALPGEKPIQLRIGVGINTGDCVVGNMGSDIRFNYSVLGDPVNLASRLESQTKEYGVPILLGPATARLLGRDFVLVELDRVRVKGKNEAVAVSTLLQEPGGGARAAHQAFLDDLYAGRADAARARTPELKSLLPSLAAYYDAIFARLGNAPGAD